MWRVSDLDLGSMTHISLRVSHGLTKLNAKQVAYVLVFHTYKTLLGNFSYHRGEA
jgi:hypothetical protein